MMLDLGCGNTVHRQVCEHAGFKYVGVDYDNSQAPFLADAHALPFRNDSFEFLLSIAVLEHIQFPFVAIREAQRVLKPGGMFIGTVAFLEPFHGNSFYHHTRLGTLNTLRYGGFDILRIAASTSWSVFAAQALMSDTKLFPGMPKAVSRNLIMLPQKISNTWRKIEHILKRSIKRNRMADHTSGAFYFVARKPGA
jgi:ubiquinone/menaquinone biosynthesis C-methylase UbiE